MPQATKQTVLTTEPAVAARVIRDGGICAFPTETVYGLGANVFDPDAVARIYEAKQRPADNPLIAHIGDLSQIESLATSVPPDAARLIAAFFPGPLTLVLKRSNRVPLIATAGLDTIGIRMPRHRLAQEFITACATPIVAPSANVSGRPSPTTWQAVYEDLNGRIDCILQGEATEIGLESTVVDCTGTVPLLLRQGAISLELLRKVVPSTRSFTTDSPEVARSPGMRHRHYSPKASVVIVERGEVIEGSNSAFIGITPNDGGSACILIAADIDEYAHSLFEFFRECDRQGVQTIYCEAVAETGIGAALMDRLRRAAQG